MQQQWKDAYPGVVGNFSSWAMTIVGRGIEQGSYSALWAATCPEVEEKNYQRYYFVDPMYGQPVKESSQASDPKLADALYILSTKLSKRRLARKGWCFGTEKG
ncbi:hypothetical protein PV04_08617 [Phialophora macrospora]|uniref:Uncharacterized protein n=1 Tax=Phialophora macrospora TaxID=1851006 RepID=A0A0D2DMS3_9EURO|nr:hypothetical protein PV04_08617 [Phialophora macrospora]